LSATPDYEWIFNVRITVKGNVTKKNTFRDNLITILQNAKTAGTIDSYEWSLPPANTVAEGGKG